MLGDAAKPGWSLKREKDVVDTLLELLTAGLMPRKRLEALDLNGLGVSVPGTSAWFLTGGALLPTPATLLPPPRASRASLQEGALAALDMSAPTGKKVPHPAAAAGLPAAVGTAATHIPESRSTRTWGWICWIISLSGVAETWWDAVGIFACPDTDSYSARSHPAEPPSRPSRHHRQRTQAENRKQK